MPPQILLTSFQTWLPHHKSNSSDDLLATIQTQKIDYARLNFLRQLPVNIQQASNLVIDRIKTTQPDAIICCGMAEKRSHLTLEAHARDRETKLITRIDLETLVIQLTSTSISYDAGKFVCEGLYYQVLNYCHQLHFNLPCLFVHVPLLTKKNFTVIQQDFNLILKFICEKAILG